MVSRVEKVIDSSVYGIINFKLQRVKPKDQQRENAINKKQIKMNMHILILHQGMIIRPGVGMPYY